MKDRCNRYCWCGNEKLSCFSDEYSICDVCDTLISQAGLDDEQIQVKDDNKDFYGREYWLSHQSQELGFPTIYQRARQDLSERCLYWLKTLLTYKLPPAKVLELGCAHGGSVALMKWAGFDATGLELSPWVVNFAKQAFDIKMLLGSIENQQLEPNSFDAIVLNDVLEHLPDPVAIVQHCITLLKHDGIIIVQTPNYIEGTTYPEMLKNNDTFLENLKPIEHLYLFNKNSIRQFFEQLDCKFLQHKPALFDYDMYFIASHQLLIENNDQQINTSLSANSSGRIVQALLDKADEADKLQQKWLAAEADRDARLVIIERLAEQLAESETDRANRLILIEQLSEQ
jgi:2-polyprenyl-3-methyl-5-hydroxy-6-metoxy-1,4-benzoquinol methylase